MIKQEQVSDRVTVVRLDHGPVSAMDIDLFEALAAEFTALAGSGRALVVTGTGRAFSAGVDLVSLLEGGEACIDQFLSALSASFDAAFRYPDPVVTAVNGHAIAGGCILANCGDYRMMAAGTARIGIPELLVGVPFPVVPLEIMRFATGGTGISKLVNLGVTLLPEEAVAHQVIDEVVPADELLDRAVARAEAMAAMPAESFRHCKLVLREPTCARIDEAASRQDPAMVEIWKSETVRAAITAYVEKTLTKPSRG